MAVANSFAHELRDYPWVDWRREKGLERVKPSDYVFPKISQLEEAVKESTHPVRGGMFVEFDVIGRRTPTGVRCFLG